MNNLIVAEAIHSSEGVEVVVLRNGTYTTFKTRKDYVDSDFPSGAVGLMRLVPAKDYNLHEYSDGTIVYRWKNDNRYYDHHDDGEVKKMMKKIEEIVSQNDTVPRVIFTKADISHLETLLMDQGWEIHEFGLSKDASRSSGRGHLHLIHLVPDGGRLEPVNAMIGDVIYSNYFTNKKIESIEKNLDEVQAMKSDMIEMTNRAGSLKAGIRDKSIKNEMADYSTFFTYIGSLDVTLNRLESYKASHIEKYERMEKRIELLMNTGFDWPKITGGQMLRDDVFLRLETGEGIRIPYDEL